MAKQWLHNTTSGICRVHIFRNKLPDGFQEQEKFLHGKNTVLHKRTKNLKSPKVFHPKDRIQTHKAGLLIAPLFIFLSSLYEFTPLLLNESNTSIKTPFPASISPTACINQINRQVIFSRFTHRIQSSERYFYYLCGINT